MRGVEGGGEITMKCEIDDTGLMRVSAETPLEAWALRCWVDAASVLVEDQTRREAMYWRGSKLLVATNQGKTI